MTTSERLDRIAANIKSAECLNAIHACRKDHPLGRDNPYKWRNAYGMVAGRPHEEQPSYQDREWLARCSEWEHNADDRLLSL